MERLWFNSQPRSAVLPVGELVFGISALAKICGKCRSLVKRCKKTLAFFWLALRLWCRAGRGRHGKTRRWFDKIIKKELEGELSIFSSPSLGRIHTVPYLLKQKIRIAKRLTKRDTLNKDQLTLKAKIRGFATTRLEKEAVPSPIPS
jgi:hypothetical protein